MRIDADKLPCAGSTWSLVDCRTGEHPKNVKWADDESHCIGVMVVDKSSFFGYSISVEHVPRVVIHPDKHLVLINWRDDLLRSTGQLTKAELLGA